MKLYAPKYYERFTCIADRCKHSCCVGWEIDVDDDTYEKYQDLQGGYGERIKESIDICDTPHFVLCEGDRCPHLNEKGLCNIILNLGEDHLCHICREHPRFYNYTTLGKEVGLGLSCEEACRIILSSDDFSEMICLREFDSESEPDNTDFDPICQRERLFGIISDQTLSYSQKIKRIEEEYHVSPTLIDDEVLRETLSSLEYLDEDHRELFSRYSSKFSSDLGFENESLRALAYFIYRHTSECFDLDDFRTSLGFCLFCERLLVSVSSTKKIQSLEEFCDIARIISEELEYSEDNTESIKSEFEIICFGEQL